MTMPSDMEPRGYEGQGCRVTPARSRQPNTHVSHGVWGLRRSAVSFTPFCLTFDLFCIVSDLFATNIYGFYN